MFCIYTKNILFLYVFIFLFSLYLKQLSYPKIFEILNNTNNLKILVNKLHFIF